MQTEEIIPVATTAGDDAFTVKRARSGKAILVYNTDRRFDAESEQLAGCGLLSKLAELSLTVAATTVLGDSTVKEMEIEILSEKRGHSLEAVAEILYYEESSATGQSDIRVRGKDGQEMLVARAFGTICRAESASS